MKKLLLIEHTRQEYDLSNNFLLFGMNDPKRNPYREIVDRGFAVAKRFGSYYIENRRGEYIRLSCDISRKGGVDSYLSLKDGDYLLDERSEEEIVKILIENKFLSHFKK